MLKWNDLYKLLKVIDSSTNRTLPISSMYQFAHLPDIITFCFSLNDWECMTFQIQWKPTDAHYNTSISILPAIASGEISSQIRRYRIYCDLWLCVLQTADARVSMCNWSHRVCPFPLQRMCSFKIIALCWRMELCETTRLRRSTW